MFLKTRDASVIDPLNWAVTISKSKHDLAVYYCGRLYARYDAVFGRNLDGSAKEYENDRRTPEGVYTIVQKNPSRRFRWFLKLNYPNLFDRQHYEMLRDSEVIPVRGDGQSPSMGGAIGIHGTDVPVLNKGHVNWTTGCVSVGNDAIAEMARLLPIGTIVVIKR